MIKPTTKTASSDSAESAAPVASSGGTATTSSGSVESAAPAVSSNGQASSATLEAAARAEAEKLMKAPEEDALTERVANLETALSQHQTIIQHLCGRLGINPSALLTE